MNDLRHIDPAVLRDRYCGALLGLAVGEALGAPAEFLTCDQVVERFGVLTEMVGGGCYNVAPGETIDATERMLCLAESLVATGGFDPEDIMARYVAWFDSRPRDVSLTVRTVILALHSGTSWDLASRRAHEILGSPTAGNGSLMRCAPLALRFAGDDERRAQLSLRESVLTHFDRLAGWACVAFNELLVAAIAGTLLARLPAIAGDLRDDDARVADLAGIA
jgi:ADP-ribosyl-[dinitrogen reductase] hydrolase